MTDPDPTQIEASPLCRVPGSPSVWMRHDMASNGVCARCGWALPKLYEDQTKSSEEKASEA